MRETAFIFYPHYLRESSRGKIRGDACSKIRGDECDECDEGSKIRDDGRSNTRSNACSNAHGDARSNTRSNARGDENDNHHDNDSHAGHSAPSDIPAIIKASRQYAYFYACIFASNRTMDLCTIDYMTCFKVSDRISMNSLFSVVLYFFTPRILELVKRGGGRGDRGECVSDGGRGRGRVSDSDGECGECVSDGGRGGCDGIDVRGGRNDIHGNNIHGNDVRNDVRGGRGDNSPPQSTYYDYYLLISTFSFLFSFLSLVFFNHQLCCEYFYGRFFNVGMYFLMDNVVALWYWVIT